MGRGRDRHTPVGKGGKESREKCGVERGPACSRARTAQKLPKAGRQAPSPRRSPQTNRCSQARFLTAQTLGRVCPQTPPPPPSKASVQKLASSPFLSPATRSGPRPQLRSPVATALLDRSGKHTWLCAGRVLELGSATRTGPYLPNPGAPNSRQRLALGRHRPSAVRPRLPGMTTPSRVRDWRVERNRILCVPGRPRAAQPIPYLTLPLLTPAEKIPRLVS